MNPIADLVHTHTHTLIYTHASVSCPLFYVRDRESGFARASFPSWQTLQVLRFMQALQTFRWECARACSHAPLLEDTMVWRPAFRKGRGTAAKVFFDLAENRSRRFLAALANRKSGALPPHHTIYHSRFGRDSVGKYDEALCSVRKEIANLIRLEVSKEMDILKSETFTPPFAEPFVNLREYASNNSKALRVFRCLLFRYSRNASTINCSITKCIQIKYNIHDTHMRTHMHTRHK